MNFTAANEKQTPYESVQTNAVAKKTLLYNGGELTPGIWVRLIAGSDATIYDNETFLLVTDQTDKKGNRLVVNTTNGSTAWASPKSIWST